MNDMPKYYNDNSYFIIQISGDMKNLLNKCWVQCEIKKKKKEADSENFTTWL